MTQKQRRAAWERQDAKTQMERYQMDNGMCQEIDCNEEGASVHHIIPKRMGGTPHVYALSEKVTLCMKHHAVLHDVGERVELKDSRIIGVRGVCG